MSSFRWKFHSSAYCGLSFHALVSGNHNWKPCDRQLKEERRRWTQTLIFEGHPNHATTPGVLTLAGFEISSCPANVAPSSIARRNVLRLPCKWAVAFKLHLWATLASPSTIPELVRLSTTMDFA